MGGKSFGGLVWPKGANETRYYEDEEEEEERLEEEKRSESTILCRLSVALHLSFILSISSILLQKRPSLKK